MATKSEPDKQTAELKAQIAKSRDYVARDLRGLRYELDFPRKIRRSFRTQTAAWVLAAVVGGTLLVLLPVRKKTVYVDLESGKKGKPQKKLLEAGFLLGLVRVAATMLRPALTNFVTKKVQGYTARQHASSKW